MGRRDGVKVGNIVGAVANEAGIDGEFIGPIKIYDSYSTVDLPEGMPRDIYQTLRRTRVVGKQLRLTQVDAKAGDARPRRGNKSHRQAKFSGTKRPANHGSTASVPRHHATRVSKHTGAKRHGAEGAKPRGGKPNAVKRRKRKTKA